MALKVEPATRYTVDDVLEMRSVSKKTLEAERIRSGGIPFSRIDRRIFIKVPTSRNTSSVTVGARPSISAALRTGVSALRDIVRDARGHRKRKI